jgi:hypothetical protein
MPEHEMRALGEAGRTFVETNYDVRRLNERILERTVGVRAAQNDTSLMRTA